MKYSMYSLERKTKETTVCVTIDFENSGKSSIKTSNGFFNHMLGTLARYAGWSISILAEGDTEVDNHHLVEDTGLVIGMAIKKRVLENQNINRHASTVLQMDDALVEVVCDISGRSYVIYDFTPLQEKCGDFETCLVKEFVMAFSRGLLCNLCIVNRYGDNSHHCIEAIFKGLGKVLHESLSLKPELISEKGVLYEKDWNN